MKKQFVTCPIAKALKDLGFNEDCFTGFNEDSDLITRFDNGTWNNANFINCKECAAPLWVQATNWLKQNTGIHLQERFDGWYLVRKTNGEEINDSGLTLEVAILKTIEIAKNAGT